jgi:hypothetical protein
MPTDPDRLFGESVGNKEIDRGAGVLQVSGGLAARALLDPALGCLEVTLTRDRWSMQTLCLEVILAILSAILSKV